MTPECINPYPGPESFARGDARPYFGRDQETGDLTSLAVTERLLVFYAPSGAGKTSLLNMRLIPRLENKLYEVLPTARVSGAPTMPANVRNVYAYNLMLRLVPGDPQPERFAELSLSDFLWHLSTEDGKTYHYDPSDQALRRATPQRDLWPRVLILDQFEEIVTAYPTYWRHREDFFRQLDDALSSDAMLRVIMSLRSDYVQDLERYAGLLQHGLRARYQMFLMGTQDAHLAIEGPAAACGRPYGAGVAQQLVRNMSEIRGQDAEGKAHIEPGETVEPIQLQVVCYQLWEKMKAAPGNRIEMKDLRRLAREALSLRSSSGDLTQREQYELLSAFVDGALGAFYEAAVEKTRATATTPVDEAFLRNWFSTQLITEGGTRGFMQRGHDETGGVPDEVVQKLVDNHLLRSDTRGSARLVELIHDRFVEPIRTANLQWNERRRRDQPWIDAAYRWCESGDSPETRNAALLLADRNLATVLHDTAGQHLEPILAEYLAASKEAQDKREQAAALETERSRAKEAEARAAQEAELAVQLRRRNIALTALAGGIALLLLVVALLAFNLDQKADALIIEKETVEQQKKTVDEQNRLLGAKNITLEISRTQLMDERDRANRNEQAATTARLENISLTLADQARRAGAVEDRLLLARAAISTSNTLAANGALLEALDQGYRAANQQMAQYVAHDTIALYGSGYPQSLAHSRDGRILAVGDDSGGIRLWDNIEGRPLTRRLNAGSYRSVTGLALDPARPRLVSATGDRYDPTSRRHDLILWNLIDPAAPQARVLASAQPSIWSIDISPDGSQLAVGNEDGEVVLWDLSSAVPVSRTLLDGRPLPPRRAGAITAVAFDETGQRLASGAEDGTIILWDGVAGSRPVSQKTLTGHTGRVNTIRFSPDGALLASAASDGQVRLWNLNDETPNSQTLDDRSATGYDEALGLAFDPDGQQVAVGWSDSAIRLYALAEAGRPPLTLVGHSGVVPALYFDPVTAGRLVSVGRDDSYPFAWDLTVQSEFVAVQPATQPVRPERQSFSPDGRWLAAAGAGGQIYLREREATGWPISFTVSVSVTALGVNALGDQLAIAGCATPTAGPQPEAPATPSKDPSAQSSPATQTGGNAALGVAGCALDIWSLAPGFPATVVRSIPFERPISALAFLPTAPDTLAVGLNSGEVQIRNLATGEVTRLDDKVPELTDIAFDSRGEYLAALGKTGRVSAWTWPEGKLLPESEAGEKEGTTKETRFNAVALIDGWLAIAVHKPDQIQLWELQTAKAVATFALDSQAYDLVTESDQRTLAAAQQDSVLRWPMSQERWLELACQRAGRNLSFAEWLKAFPDAPDFGDALICPYPLDVSFAQDMVDRAARAIDDCNEEQWDNGLALLREAAALQVQPPLALDPADKAVAVLVDKALEHLRQHPTDYDAEARACLELAAQKRSQQGAASFSVDAAMELGKRQATLETRLDSARLTDAQGLLQDVAWIETHSNQWPGALPTIMLEPGREVSGALESGRDVAHFFLGRRGQKATISLAGADGAQDMILRMERPGRSLLTESYPYQDQFDVSVDNIILPEDGLYRVIPSSYSGSGDYRLFLTLQDTPMLAFDKVITATTAENQTWLFSGQAGQIVALDLETAATGSGVQSFEVQRLDDSSWYPASNPSVTDTAARTGPIMLPAEDLYVVKVGLGDSPVPYTLTLRLVEPQPLALGSGTAYTPTLDGIWTFTGQPGQIIRVSLVASDTFNLPTVELLSSNGGVLVSAAADWQTGVASIPGYMLGSSAPYYVRVTDLEAQSPYLLSVEPIQPSALRVGSSVSSSTDGQTFWTLDGEPGQIVQISLDTTGDDGLDPLVRFFGPDGQQINWDDDSGLDRNSLLTLVLPEEPGNLVQADGYGGSSGAFTLGTAVLEPEPLPAVGTSATILPDRAWQVEGLAGQVLTVFIQDDDVSGIAYLQLVTPDGAALAANEGDMKLTALLPRDGTYFLLPLEVADRGEDSFNATVTDPPGAANLSEVASQNLRLLARNGAIDDALALYEQGSSRLGIDFTYDALNSLCRHGALGGAADRVLAICERLPTRAGPGDAIPLADYRDSRGLARALTGNIDGAIADFEYYADSNGYYTAQRREWVERLRRGDPVSEILSTETLRLLREQ